MVLIMGGYAMPYADAKAWALRHWPDINIFDDERLPFIVERHYRRLGGSISCLPISLDGSDEFTFFFVVYSKRDPQSTPYNYRRFPEGKLALKCKEFLFSQEGDEELAEKMQFVTIADPWREWLHYPPNPSTPSSDSEDAEDAEDATSE